MFTMGPVHTRTMTLGVSDTEPKLTAKSKGLTLVCPGMMGFGVGVLVHPTKTPDGPQVEPKF